MAEKVTGKSWEDLMREKIFRPLGMTTAGFGAPGTRAKNDQPRGHKADGSPVEPGPGADNPVAIGPAGIVHCSIGDWAKFAAANLPSAKTKLVKPETLEKLHTPAPGEPKYAMGWIIADGQPWAGGPALTHAGSNTMWYRRRLARPRERLRRPRRLQPGQRQGLQRRRPRPHRRPFQGRAAVGDRVREQAEVTAKCGIDRLPRSSQVNLCRQDCPEGSGADMSSAPAWKRSLERIRVHLRRNWLTYAAVLLIALVIIGVPQVQHLFEFPLLASGFASLPVVAFYCYAAILIGVYFVSWVVDRTA